MYTSENQHDNGQTTISFQNAISFFPKNKKKHMTRFHHCHLSFSGVSSVYQCLSVFSKDGPSPHWTLPNGVPPSQPKELRHVNFQPLRPWSQSNVGCNEAHSASVVVNLTLVEAVLKRGKTTFDFLGICTRRAIQSINMLYYNLLVVEPTPFEMGSSSPK